MKQCKCGSYAFNLYKEDIDQGDLCDVHYWKEKALAQPEQEPVAKYTGETWCGSVVSLYEDIPLDTLLCTTTPHRTWVGLTDEELQDVWPFVFKPHELGNKAIYQAIEAKLKEKNT